MSRAERLLFSFLRLGLYGDTRENIVWAEADDWDELFSLSCRQAVFGIVADGIAMTAMRPPLALWQKWIALLLHTEMMNEEMAWQGDRLVGMLAADGIKASVFKGTSVARWYPKPAHRSYGDIDIVVHEGWERLAPLLQRKAIPYYEEDKAIVTEHLGHARDAAQRFSSYDWQYRTEFHPVYEFIYNPLMNTRLRQITAGTSTWWNARFGRSGRPYEVPEFYLACVILHLRRHVLSYGTGLKQVCDVAVMVKYADVDLAKLRAILQHLGAWRFGKALLDFVKTYLYDERERPRGNSRGKATSLLYGIFMGDGYALKTRREDVGNATRRSSLRIAKNCWFWTKRSLRLFRLMPNEAFSFMLYKTAQRVGKWCGQSI